MNDQVHADGPMPAEIDVQFASDALQTISPSAAFVVDWALRAMEGDQNWCTVRLVDHKEIALLNGQFRQKESTTNVLAFESGLPPELALGFLGDIVICVPVVVEEALAQNKALEAHFAHMVVHGVLHLRGFDHIDADDAEIMEQRETRLLALKGIKCPYIQCSGDDTSSHG